MDLNTLMFPANSSIHASALKRCRGEDAPENNRMQNWCENYLLKESDRIYFPGSVKSVVSLGLNQMKLVAVTLIIPFFKICLPVMKSPMFGVCWWCAAF